MIKILFCAPFPVEILTPEVKLKNWYLKSHPCSWIRALSSELIKSSEIDLHIITVNSNLACDQIIKKNDIIYHLLESALPPWIRRFLKLSSSSSLWLNPLWKMRKEIKRINPNIVHGHGTESYFSLMAVYSGFPNIISIQGIIAEIFKEEPSFRFRLLKHIEAHAIRKAKYINPKTRISESFVTYLSPHSEIFFIEAPINKIFWSKPQPEFAQNIFFVGPLIKRKGIEEFIRCYLMLKSKFVDLKGYVIGDNSNELKKKFIDWVQEAGFAKDLIFTGQISHEKIVNLYNKGGVFCLTSHVENSPNTVMEAMASGLPIVATNVGAVKYLVEDRASGLLVQKKCIPDMVKSISKLLYDKSLQLSFGKLGREIATLRWKQEIIARKHIDMYRQILKKELFKYH